VAHPLNSELVLDFSSAPLFATLAKGGLHPAGDVLLQIIAHLPG
jgi:hypothetical protein